MQRFQLPGRQPGFFQRQILRGAQQAQYDFFTINCRQCGNTDSIAGVIFQPLKLPVLG